MEVWQSPAYCNSLENCRVERHREFESHRFRQINAALAQSGEHSTVTAEVRGSKPLCRAKLWGIRFKVKHLYSVLEYVPQILNDWFDSNIPRQIIAAVV